MMRLVFRDVMNLSYMLLTAVYLNGQICTNVSAYQSEVPSVTEEAITFDVDNTELSQLVKHKSPNLNFKLPFLNNTELDLELQEIKIHAPGFRLVERSEQGDTAISYQLGAYYIGIVKGYEASRVIITFHEQEISGILTYKGVEYNLGKLLQSTKHILYKADATDEDMALKCATDTNIERPAKQTFQQRKTSCNSFVDVYFECDYQMYQNFNSSSTAVTNYVNTLFAEVNNLYSNENINIQISEIVVWTTNDGYSSGTAGLSDFASANSNGFNGDLAHLLTNDSGSNGGVAYVDQLCGNLPFAYSDIVNSSQVYPTYTWDVQVVAHEMGHNFGSSHTHDCVWGPNGNQQIDDCGNIALGGGGSCYNASSPIVPSGGGTVMSYCHVNSVGINFNLGFGPEPGDLIRNNYSSCMCDNSTCGEANEITATGTFYAEPNNGNGASSSSASHADWFVFTPTSNGTIDINSCNQGRDTRLWLHSGNCTNLSFEASSDDDCTSSGTSNYASQILSHSVMAGTSYYIEWDNRWSTAGFSWEFVFNSTGGGSGGGSSVIISCPQDYMGQNTCSPSSYATSLTGLATSTTSGATISYSDHFTTTTCTNIVDRTWVATDIAGNSASCIQMIDLDDNTSPTVTYCPGNIVTTSNSSCEAIVSWTTPAVVDGCTSVVNNSNYNSGATFGLGSTTVNYTFTDQCGNSSTCNFLVTVNNGCGAGGGSTSGLNDCDAAYVYLNSTITTENYNAEQMLQASGNVAQNATPVFKAGQEVNLLHGFEVPLGATLEVTIEDCNN